MKIKFLIKRKAEELKSFYTPTEASWILKLFVLDFLEIENSMYLLKTR